MEAPMTLFSPELHLPMDLMCSLTEWCSWLPSFLTYVPSSWHNLFLIIFELWRFCTSTPVLPSGTMRYHTCTGMCVIMETHELPITSGIHEMALFWRAHRTEQKTEIYMMLRDSARSCPMYLRTSKSWWLYVYQLTTELYRITHFRAFHT